MTDKEKELQAEAIGYYRKRIAELEMTVGTLRNFSNEQATCIERLEKENAELKHTIATLRQEKDNVSMHAKAMEVVAKTRSEQLTKAKVALRNVIDYLGQFCSDYPDCVIEAEQFLREVEK